MASTNDQSQADLTRILESARRLGVEVKEAEALQWLAQMAASKEGDQITLDERTGVFGHNITMLDFSDKELEYFRRVGKIVEFDDVPGVDRNRPGAVGLVGPVQDPDLPRRLRLL